MELPYPFQSHSDAWTARGMYQPHIQIIFGETDDQRLHQFMLYAQERSKGKRWSVRGVYDENSTEGQFCLKHLRIEYDIYRQHNITDINVMMRIEFTIPVNHQGSTNLLGAEGVGFYSLIVRSASALCPTMAGALFAIDAFIPYIQTDIVRHTTIIERFELNQHIRQCLRIMRMNGAPDVIIIAALQRKLVDLIVF